MGSKLHLAFLSVLAVAFLASLSMGQETPGHETTLSYKTTTAPTIDGVPEEGEWDDAGPWLVVNAENGGPGVVDGSDDEYGGDEDASFRFKSMWREDTFEAYFLFEVFDDIGATEQPRDDRNWERDQVELFIDGNDLEGNSDLDSYIFWNADIAANPESYGKFGVSRDGLYEGNVASLTDDADLWQDFDPDAPILAVANVSDTGTSANYFVEYGITLERIHNPPLFDESFPFEDTPTGEAGHIVADSTALKFTASISDDDDIDFEEGVSADANTDRAHGLTYYRVEETEWNDSTGFSNLVFTGEWDGIIPATCEVPDGGLLGDLDGNGEVAFADFLTLSGNFGTSGDLTYADGDIDCDGEVAFADFLSLSGNFGKSVGGAASVPEPSSAVMLLIGLVAITQRRRR